MNHVMVPATPTLSNTVTQKNRAQRATARAGSDRGRLMHDFTSVSLPKRMRGLSRDRRGYPIPFVVFRDKEGKPHFTINDHGRAERCRKERRCPICGNKLGKELWFVGGPQSAFHANGAYMDTAMHHECMTYALKVCPYLAVPKYLGRIDAGTLKPEAVPKGMLLVDHTQIPERPDIFVAVMAYNQTFTAERYSIPERPYRGLEYWKHGKQVESLI